jgi:hypothetical protein
VEWHDWEQESSSLLELLKSVQYFLSENIKFYNS